MISLPQNLRVACFQFDIEAIEPLHLPPYKGSTLRGGFGYAFKKMVCQQKDWRACTPCKNGNDCPYGYIFETSVPDDSEVLSNLGAIPRPFVIRPPLEKRRDFQPGERLAFGLTLVGEAINYIPYFLLAFKELGHQGIGYPRGRYSLQRVVAAQPWQGKREIVYDGVDVRVSDGALHLTPETIGRRAEALSPEQVTVKVLTPARLKHGGEFARRPEFHVLVRTLLRRLSSLSYFHCGQRWEADYRGIIEQAKGIELARADVRWAQWERFSGRQEKRIKMGGVVGTLTYRGELAPFRPLLALGEVIHVGKATVFGNGCYQIVAGADS